MAESIDHSDSTEFMSDEPRTLEDFEASCEEFDVSDDEDFGHKENSFLDITIIATIRQDLVNLRRASSLSAVDAVIPTPPTALNISTLIGQLFCCDDSIIVKAVTVLASAARERKDTTTCTRLVFAKSVSEWPCICHTWHACYRKMLKVATKPESTACEGAAPVLQ